MFDDPKKELKKLEDELLKQETPEDDFESFYKDILEEFGTDVEQTAVPAKPRQPGKKASTYADTPRAVAPKKKSLKGLVAIVTLECIGIAALIAYWIVQIF